MKTEFPKLKFKHIEVQSEVDSLFWLLLLIIADGLSKLLMGLSFYRNGTVRVQRNDQTKIALKQN